MANEASDLFEIRPLHISDWLKLAKECMCLQMLWYPTNCRLHLVNRMMNSLVFPLFILLANRYKSFSVDIRQELLVAKSIHHLNLWLELQLMNLQNLLWSQGFLCPLHSTNFSAFETLSKSKYRNQHQLIFKICKINGSFFHIITTSGKRIWSKFLFIKI